PQAATNPLPVTKMQVVRGVWDWDVAIYRSVFRSLGHFVVVAIALAVLLVGGLALAWIGMAWTRWRRVASPIVALALAGLFFTTQSGYGRWFLGLGASPRYIYLGAAFLLPAFAVAANAVVRRWRVAAPVMVVLLLLAVPWNF